MNELRRYIDDFVRREELDGKQMILLDRVVDDIMLDVDRVLGLRPVERMYYLRFACEGLPMRQVRRLTEALLQIARHRPLVGGGSCAEQEQEEADGPPGGAKLLNIV